MNQPQIAVLPERPVAFVAHHGPVDEIDVTRRPLYRHMIMNELVGGPSILRFLDKPEGEHIVDALVVTHVGFDGDNVCQIEQLPAGQYAILDFEGPETGLPAARKALRDWVAKQGRKPAGQLLQVHHMDAIEGIVEEQLQLHLA